MRRLKPQICTQTSSWEETSLPSSSVDTHNSMLVQPHRRNQRIVKGQSTTSLPFVNYAPQITRNLMIWPGLIPLLYWDNRTTWPNHRSIVNATHISYSMETMMHLLSRASYITQHKESYATCPTQTIKLVCIAFGIRMRRLSRLPRAKTEMTIGSKSNRLSLITWRKWGMIQRHKVNHNIITIRGKIELDLIQT